MVDGHRTHSTINSPTNTSFTSFRLPLQRLTSAQRNHDRVSKRVALGNATSQTFLSRQPPLALLQLHKPLVPRQSVEVGAILPTLNLARHADDAKASSLSKQPSASNTSAYSSRLTNSLKQPTSPPRRVPTCAALLALLVLPHVRRRIRAEKESLAARTHRRQQRLAMFLALQDRETVEVGLQPAHEETCGRGGEGAHCCGCRAGAAG